MAGYQLAKHPKNTYILFAFGDVMPRASTSASVSCDPAAVLAIQAIRAPPITGPLNAVGDSMKTLKNLRLKSGKPVAESPSFRPRKKAENTPAEAPPPEIVKAGEPRQKRMKHNAKDDLLDLSSSLVRTLRAKVPISSDHPTATHWTDDFKAAHLMIESEIERTYGPLPQQMTQLTRLVEDWREAHGVVPEWTVYALLHIAVRYSCAAPNALEALLPFNLAVSKLTRRIKRAKERIDEHWANESGIILPAPWC